MFFVSCGHRSYIKFAIVFYDGLNKLVGDLTCQLSPTDECRIVEIQRCYNLKNARISKSVNGD